MDFCGLNLAVLLFVVVVCAIALGSFGALIGNWKGHRSMGLAIGLAAAAVASALVRLLVLGGE